MKWKDILFYGFLLLAVGTFLIGFVLIPSLDSSDHVYVVVSGSMEPTLKIGDIVFVTHIHPADIHPGDIITFNRDGYKVTHRCIKVIFDKENWTWSFVTKGDQNDEPDRELVLEKDLIGKVYSIKIFGSTFYVKIPRLGYLSYFLHTFWGYLIFIVVPALFLIGTGIYDFLVMLFDEKNVQPDS